jgi:uncharacterized membrane protein
MSDVAHLWAVGYDDVRRAKQVRDHITRLSERHCLVLRDTAVAVRYADGSFTLDGEPFVLAGNICRRGLASLLAHLALGAPPLTGAAVGFTLRSTGCTGTDAAAISEDFVGAVEEMMKPGTSALFVLDQVGDLDAILQGIHGLGGTVLSTTVDLPRASLIQSTLAAPATHDDTQHGI